MSDRPVTVSFDPKDPAFRAAVIEVIDSHVTDMVTSWADRLAAAGYPDAGQWLRQQVTP